ncbi:MAG TPA: DNA replication/repair protein RecF [Geobacteraceae bacterium]
MMLKKLYINAFRNLEQADLAFGNRFNIFFGNNAQGKTNLLESIYLLGTMKSFRQARTSELIRWGTTSGMLQGWVERDGVTREIAILLEKEGKKVRVDRKSVAKLADFFGSLNVVLFSPEELAMTRGMPDGRRRYLDRAIFSGDADYLRLHHDYYRILKNRNLLLRKGDTGDLDVWSDQLAEAGARLIARRITFLAEIEPLLQAYYDEISGRREEAGLKYLPHLSGGDLGRGGEATLLREALAKSATEERRRGTTLVGPHRDDVEFFLNGMPLRRFGSQGQCRSFVLALKMAEISYLERKFGNPPILLLDDMTSELDRERNRNLMEFLAAKRMQVFITTTTLQNIALPGMEQYRTFRVEAGRVLSEDRGNHD